MAKKRVLNDDGSFSDYVGPKPTHKVVSPESKIALRKKLETKAFKFGFNPNNPVDCGLSKDDYTFIESASDEAINALCEVRGVDAPEEISSQAPAVEGLTEEDKEVIKAGISIPEMRKLAKERSVVIPKDKKKAIDIQAFLLEEEDEDL